MSVFAPDASGVLLAEQTGGQWTDYVWLNGRLVTLVRGGNVYAVHDDQVGRPEAVTNASQQVVWRASNYAFDRTVTTDNLGGLNLGFPGQYYDAETGYWNNGFRDYDSLLGRYVESDPIGLGGGVNTYAYVLNNPLSGSDIFGLQEDSVKRQQAENAVQGAVNEASAAVIPDRAGAISDVGGDLAAGAIAFGSVLQSEAEYDYSMYNQDPGNHFYAKFDGMDWSQYPNFSEAWKAYLKKHMKGKKCP